MQIKLDIEKVKDALPSIKDITFVNDGGFKFVYHGLIENDKQAIKLVYIPKNDTDETVEEENLRRIFRELAVIDKTKTPSLVKLGNFAPIKKNIDGNTFYIYSEEFLEGNSLKSLIENKHRSDNQELIILCKCILYCIVEFKGKGIIHRDIKPANIIKTNDPKRQFVLLDLGLAFIQGDSHLTHNPAGVPGTEGYLSPEMLDSGFRDNLDYRSDLHSLGLTLYEYATGINPFRKKKDNQYSTLMNIKNNTPVKLNELRPDLNNYLCDLIDNWLKKKPMLRKSNLEIILTELGSL